MDATPGPSTEAPTGRGAGLAGVVLAGGESRRMGRDKATLTVTGWFEGRTFVEQVVAVVGRRCAPVFVVGAPGRKLPDLPATVLHDESPGLGPLPAVGLGLRAAAVAGTSHAFVCAVDMPFITTDLIDALTSSVADREADIVLPSDGHDHYLCALYRTRLAQRIETLVATGERRVGALGDLVATRSIAMADTPGLVNLNSPDDLDRLRPGSSGPGH